jgi:hypothetical protein
MGRVPLEDALALVVLYAEQGEERFEEAAVRWLGRLFLEKQLSFPSPLNAWSSSVNFAGLKPRGSQRVFRR